MDLDLTGKERDAETGLDYFGARYFSGAQGRFTSPDEWAGGIVDPFTGGQVGQPGPLPYADITDPQTLNKYAYVRNNPLRYIDPNGHDFWDYVKGAVNAFTSDNAAGLGRIDGGNEDFRMGQAVGDAIATVTGTTEALFGGGEAVVTSPAAVTVVGAVVPAAGAAVAAHGATTAVVAGGHLINAAFKKSTGPLENESPGTTASGHPTDQYGTKLGPSGKPAIHNVDHPTKKAAKDAARNAGQGAPMQHPSPQRGKPHYHPVDRKGKKIPDGTHHNYPE